MRDEIDKFAQAMETTMQKHDAVKGDSWKRMEVSRLELLLTREISEFVHASFRQDGSKEKREALRAELIDVANLLMMVWNRKAD